MYGKDCLLYKGGVLIVVKNNLVFIFCFDLDLDCEIIWCEVFLEREVIIFGFYYCLEFIGMDLLDVLEVFLIKVL